MDDEEKEFSHCQTELFWSIYISSFVFDLNLWKDIGSSNQEFQQSSYINGIHTSSICLIAVCICQLLCIEVNGSTLLLLESNQIRQGNGIIQIDIAIKSIGRRCGFSGCCNRCLCSCLLTASCGNRCLCSCCGRQPFRWLQWW